MSFRKKLVAAFEVALAILIGVGVLSYLKIRQDSDDQAWVEHTHGTLEKLDAFQTDFAGAGTGQRSYIVTGEKTYLDEYEDFVERLNKESEELKQLTADNPVQQRSLIKLLALVSARLADMQKRVETFQREGRPPRPAGPGAGGQSERPWSRFKSR